MFYAVLANAVENLWTIDYKNVMVSIFVIMASVIAIYELVTRFAKMIHTIKSKQDNPIDTLRQQGYDELDKVKKRQEDFEAKLDAIRNAEMIILWDRLMHFGMQYIKRGHISYAEEDVIMKQYEAYHVTGGNGHLEQFIKRIKKLPYTEELSADEIKQLEDSFGDRATAIKEASKELSAYYVDNGQVPKHDDL